MRRPASRLVDSPTPAWGDSQAEVQSFREQHVRRSVRLRRVVLAAAFLLMAAGLIAIGWTLGRIGEREPPRRGILPGEFEPQEGLLLSWPANLSRAEQQVLVDVIGKTSPQLEVVVAVADYATQQRAAEMLDAASVPRSAVRFVRTPVDSMWVRDFGPFVLKSFSGSWEILDVEYGLNRAGDDDLPQVLGDLLQLDQIHAPFVLEGGNILSNGAGLCLTTRAVLERNAARYSEKQISRLLGEFLGAQEVIYLDYLQGEDSAHIDIFATLVAPDAVVIGRYTQEQDPVNAEILDRNAQRLSGVMTASGPLRVYRVPMPTRVGVGRAWPTYANVVYANGVLLVPTADASAEREQLDEALAVYRALLPGWDVVALDCGPLLNKGGGLHCATMNLFRLKRG